MDTRKERERQFANLVKPAKEEYSPAIKISNVHGSTDWLSITDIELKEIMHILTK